MKLIKLKIENIASVETAEVNFDSEPLADASVFLITGDTGSGKSTILDAICLALYNTTPRLNIASGTKSNFSNDNITARNTSNLLRHGARQASAILWFVGSDGIDYEAVWHVKRNRNNRLTPPEQTLTWGSVTVRNAEAVKKIVDDAVGLDFDQFCRTTMLAQGQFTQFLKSRDDEKSEILEKLTGTEIYSEIGKKIEEIKKEKETEYIAQKNITAGIVFMKTEERQALKEKLLQVETGKKVLEVETGRIDACVRWLEDYYRVKTEMETAFKSVEAGREVMNSDSFKAEAKLISDMDRSERARNNLRKLNEAKRKIRSLETELDEMEKQYVELCKGRNGLKEWIESKKSYLFSVGEKIKSAESNVPMYENVQKIETLLNSAYEASLRVKKNTGVVSGIKNDLPVLDKNCSDVQEKLNEVDKAVKQKEAEYERAESELKKFNPEGINNEINRLNIEKDDINVLNGNIIELKNCKKFLERLEKEVVLLNGECRSRNVELARISEKYENINRRYIDARKAYDGVQLSLKEWTVNIRRNLNIGDNCPVCGQRIESLVTDEECNERLKPLEKMVVELEKELHDAAASCNGVSMIIERLKKDISAKENEKRNAVDAMRIAEENVLRISERLSEASVDSAGVDVNTIEDLMRRRIGQLSVRMEELIGIQKKINEGNRYLSGLNNELSVLRKDMDNVVKDMDRVKNERLSAVKEIDRISSLITADNDIIRDSLSDAGKMITLDGWKEQWNIDAHSFVGNVKNAASEYAGWEKEIAATEKLLSQAIPALDSIEKMLAAVSEKCTKWTDRKVDETVLIDRLQDKCMAFLNQVQVLVVSLDSERRNEQISSEELERFLASEHGMDRIRLEFLQTIDNLREIREKHDGKIAEFRMASGVFDAKKKELEKILSERPENFSEESSSIDMLKLSSSECRAKMDELTAEMGRIDQQIKDDERNVVRFSAEKDKEERLRTTFAEWDALNKLFGGGDGKIFRKIAQSFILNDLLQRANGYLRKLNNRYSLDCEPGTLTIRMMDMYQNDAQGPVDILSGGEGFLVSLSLALALSSLNRRNLSVDTLFIDEGFGTLSSEVLNMVMNLLEKLQSLNGKRVGIISHVEGLKERIAVQVKVKRIDLTRSTVEVVDYRI